MCVYAPYIPNIEQLSQLTISSLGSESFGENRYDMIIKQQTTLEVSDTEKVVDDNEELHPSPPQNI